MSRHDQVWVHWGEHIDDRGYWVKRDRGCDYCAVIMGARPEVLTCQHLTASERGPNGPERA